VPNAAQNCSHAGCKFISTERLGKIVVGSSIKACDPVRVLRPRSQHYDWNIASTAYLGEYSKAVQSWQHDIEDDEVKWTFKCALEAGESIVGHRQEEAVLLQELSHEPAEFNIVIDEKHGRRGPIGRRKSHLPPSCG
jgi:hypothetical protein